MKKVIFKEGDLFFINDVKLGNKILTFEKKHRVGKLIYISSLFKDMIGFLPSKETFESVPFEVKDLQFMEGVIYTGNSELNNGNWKIIGNQDVTDEEVLLTKRRVANAIMIKDNEVRICTQEDYEKYKNQGIAGLGAVHYLLMNL